MSQVFIPLTNESIVILSILEGYDKKKIKMKGMKREVGVLGYIIQHSIILSK